MRTDARQGWEDRLRAAGERLSTSIMDRESPPPLEAAMAVCTSLFERLNLDGVTLDPNEPTILPLHGSGGLQGVLTIQSVEEDRGETAWQYTFSLMLDPLERMAKYSTAQLLSIDLFLDETDVYYVSMHVDHPIGDVVLEAQDIDQAKRIIRGARYAMSGSAAQWGGLSAQGEWFDGVPGFTSTLDPLESVMGMDLDESPALSVLESQIRTPGGY